VCRQSSSARAAATTGGCASRLSCRARHRTAPNCSGRGRAISTSICVAARQRESGCSRSVAHAGIVQIIGLRAPRCRRGCRSGAQPSRPAKTGSTSDGRAPRWRRAFSGRSSRRAIGAARPYSGRMRGTSKPLPSSSRRDEPAGRVGDRRQNLRRRRDFGEFPRIGRADIGKRIELAVGCAPQAQARRRRLLFSHTPGSAARA